MLIEWKEKESFISDIESLFFDIVDEYNIEELPDDIDIGEDINGIYYHINDFPLRVDLEKPYVEILIWIGNEDLYRFEKFSMGLNSLALKLSKLGFKSSMENMDEYLSYAGSEWNPEPYTIIIYYPIN